MFFSGSDSALHYMDSRTLLYTTSSSISGLNCFGTRITAILRHCGAHIKSIIKTSTKKKGNVLACFACRSNTKAANRKNPAYEEFVPLGELFHHHYPTTVFISPKAAIPQNVA